MRSLLPALSLFGLLVATDWHQRVGERTMPMDMHAGGSVAVELSLPVDTP